MRGWELGVRRGGWGAWREERGEVCGASIEGGDRGGDVGTWRAVGGEWGREEKRRWGDGQRPIDNFRLGYLVRPR